MGRSRRRYAEGDSLFVEGIAAVRRSADPKLSLYLRFYGEYLTRTRVFEAAEAALLEAHRLSQAAKGRHHPGTKEAGAALAALYKAWGRDESAEQWESSSAPPRDERQLLCRPPGQALRSRSTGGMSNVK